MADFDPFDTSRDEELDRQLQPLYEEYGGSRDRSGGGSGGFLRRLWIPLACVAVLAAAAVLFGGAILLRFAPGRALGSGGAKLAKSIEKRFAGSPYQAAALLGRTVVEGGALNGTFDYADGYYDASGSFELRMDPKARAYSLSTDLTAGGSMLNGTLYVDRERAAVKSPFLPDCYGITYRTFAGDLRKSALPGYFGLGEQELREAEEAVGRLERLMNGGDGGTAGELDKGYRELYETFIRSLELKGSTEKVEVGGRQVSCGVVTARLDEAQIEKLLLDAAELTCGNAAVRDGLVLELIASGELSEEEARASLDEIWDEVLEKIKETMSKVDCDLDLCWYLHGGQVVRIDILGEIKLDGEPGALDLSLDFGLEPEKDDWVLTGVASTAGGKMEAATVTYGSESSESGYRDTLTVETRGETITAGTEWDRRSGDLTLRAEGGGESLRYRCRLLAGGESCELTLTDFGALFLDGERLELTLTSDAKAKVESPDFLNLDRWDQDVLSDIEDAVIRLPF